MLAGRESLVRLIGKRRRILPNRASLLASAPLVESCLNCNLGKDATINEDEDAGDMGNDVSNKMSPVEWVICPVCEKNIKGGHAEVNSHLDICLIRGTKRKLTQCTLLQLNFRRGSKIKVCNQELEQSTEKQNVVLNSCLPTYVEDLLIDNYGIPSADNNTESICTNETTCYFESPGLSTKEELHSHLIGVCTDNEEDISRTILDTFVVGRKFSNVKEVTFGMKVSLMREPENIKDPNAVKVFSADLNTHLGYLPRSLAQFMSPLIDRHSLQFEGCVASLPAHHLEGVAIQISCCGFGRNSEKSYQDIEDIRYLWRNVLQEIENGKRNPPDLTKYQQNFCVFINEVLLSCSYLFTEDEKLFMESFASLSNDSQRLFIRLYSRKGPWFPLSKISYPEISNVEQAIEVLSERGFMLPYVSDSGHSDDFAGILATLNVSELHELRRMHDKEA